MVHYYSLFLDQGTAVLLLLFNKARARCAGLRLFDTPRGPLILQKMEGVQVRRKVTTATQE